MVTQAVCSGWDAIWFFCRDSYGEKKKHVVLRTTLCYTENQYKQLWKK